MLEWHRQIQVTIDEIDTCIKNHNAEVLTLHFLSQKLGYSEYYISRKFHEISGMQFRAYLRYRRLAFALKEIRDTDRGILDIAIDYGFFPMRHLPVHSRKPTASHPVSIERILLPLSFAPSSSPSTAIY